MGNAPLAAPWAGDVVVRLHREGKVDVEAAVRVNSEWTSTQLLAVVSKALRVDGDALVCPALHGARALAGAAATLRACGLRPGAVLDVDVAEWAGRVAVYRDDGAPLSLPATARTTVAQLLYDAHVATGAPASSLRLRMYDAASERWRSFDDAHATLAACGVRAASALQLGVGDDDAPRVPAGAALAAAAACAVSTSRSRRGVPPSSSISSSSSSSRSVAQPPPLRAAASGASAGSAPASPRHSGGGGSATPPLVRTLTPSVARREGRESPAAVAAAAAAAPAGGVRAPADLTADTSLRSLGGPSLPPAVRARGYRG